MREITLVELLEAGCHFGHQVTRHNPKSRDYIFEARDNIHIIDLAKTKEGLDAAASYVYDLAKKGGTIIVVGTKRQAEPIVVEEVKRVRDAGVDGMFSVTKRWIGGTLTNFSEVLKNYKKLTELEAKLVNEEEKSKYTKKEIGFWAKELQKLKEFYGGIVGIQAPPDALFIIDSHNEYLAVREANQTGVTTVAVVDTNADPYIIDHPIPANDDAVGSIKLIMSHIADAWIEGRKDKESGIKNEELRVVSNGSKKTEDIKESKPKKSVKSVKEKKAKQEKTKS